MPSFLNIALWKENLTRKSENHGNSLKSRGNNPCPPQCGRFRGKRAHLLTWAKRASMRPLGVYLYCLGSQSCAFRRISVRSARLRPRTRPRGASLVEFVASAVGRSLRAGYFGLRPQSRPCRAAPRSLPFAARLLPAASSPIPRAILRHRNTDFLVWRGSRREAAAPHPLGALRLRRRHTARSSRTILFRGARCKKKVRNRKRGRALR